jgi:hypothetical protein
MASRENLFYTSLKEALELGEEVDITFAIGDDFWPVYGATVVKLTSTAVKLNYPISQADEDRLNIDNYLLEEGELTIRTKVMEIYRIVQIDYVSSRLTVDKLETDLGTNISSEEV